MPTFAALKTAYEFLAHAFLSGDDPEVLFGNFVADSIKGKMIEKYTGAMLNGVHLHRAIDAYTDNHPIVKQSVKRLQPEFRRFSPVIVDMYYDHFWLQTGEVMLRTNCLRFQQRFIGFCYATILNCHHDPSAYCPG